MRIKMSFKYNLFTSFPNFGWPHNHFVQSLMENKADQMKHTQVQIEWDGRWGPIPPASCGPWKRSVEPLNPHRPVYGNPDAVPSASQL